MGDIFAAVVDLETTGLSANHDVPLEIGVKLIDKDGNDMGSREWLVWERNDEYQAAIDKGKRNEFVGPMHIASGLWQDLYDVSIGAGANHPDRYSRDEVDNELCDFLTEHEVRFGTIPMLGNSIGSLDRPFCLVHFPMFNGALSYRNIDMSSIKELVKVHNPTLWGNLKPIIGDKTNAKHRVMGDIDACIAEYQAYIENFFFLED